jgi:hypothetical protein
MARDTLASIISEVRSLIGDPLSASMIFTDDEIQDALDQRREEARYARLLEQPTITPGSGLHFLTFDAPLPRWEDGAIVVDASFNPLTPDTVDLKTGRWTFATQPRYPVLLIGWTHDVYGAAADLLRMWATRTAQDYDVKADGTELARSQKTSGLQRRADEMAARARPRLSSLIRTDEVINSHQTSDTWPYL